MEEPDKDSRTAPNTVSVNVEKWTSQLMDAGYTVIPNVIFERQEALGLDAIDINILLHLAGAWWTKDSKPSPSKSTIAKAMKLEPRSIQRRVKAMEDLGFIRREERRLSNNNSKTNIYHLEGLIEHAKPFAQDKIEERARKAAERTALLKKKGTAATHSPKSAPAPMVAAGAS